MDTHFLMKISSRIIIYSCPPHTPHLMNVVTALLMIIHGLTFIVFLNVVGMFLIIIHGHIVAVMLLMIIHGSIR
ncbi:hypothetical protein RchiOBHm_Chr3g0459931 [Rosa chinensis]|uniref:Uncharacterized protein n=1 Tax=Rosa chinensis TaxID=74649 RepID=A0A2P6R898_ROSCH|nr:hypothetical protein RchiOBHm_Chr3g0459931 [Rosa chinensis]